MHVARQQGSNKRGSAVATLLVETGHEWPQHVEFREVETTALVCCCTWVCIQHSHASPNTSEIKHAQLCGCSIKRQLHRLIRVLK